MHDASEGKDFGFSVGSGLEAAVPEGLGLGFSGSKDSLFWCALVAGPASVGGEAVTQLAHFYLAHCPSHWDSNLQ